MSNMGKIGRYTTLNYLRLPVKPRWNQPWSVLHGQGRRCRAHIDWGDQGGVFCSAGYLLSMHMVLVPTPAPHTQKVLAENMH